MIRKILIQVLVRDYYRRNGGFMALMIIAGFAFLRSEEHLAMARYACRTPAFLFGIFGTLWILYTGKATLFVLRSLNEQQNEILYLSGLLPLSEQVRYLLLVQVGLLQPILYYGAFVCTVGFSQGGWLPIVSVLGVLCMCLLLPTGLYCLALKRPNTKQNRLYSFGGGLGVSRPAFFIPQHLLKNEPVLLFLTKLFSMSILIGVCELYPTDEYDNRLISLGLLIAGIAQGTLVHPFYFFEKTQLAFMANLPLTCGHRFRIYLLAWFVLLLPEIVAFARQLPPDIGWVYGLSGVFYLLSLAMLIHFLLFYRPYTQEEIGKPVFCFFIVSFLAIMYRVPIWTMASLQFLCAAYSLLKGYYKTEFALTQKSEY